MEYSVRWKNDKRSGKKILTEFLKKVPLIEKKANKQQLT